MENPFVGEIAMFAGDFAPRGWAFCDGQELPIQNNESLFSLLGTTYGGDGRRTFKLPDLRGRGPIHAGSGDGLSPRRVGQHGGAESVALAPSQVPQTGATTVKADDDGSIVATQATGNGQAHDNMPPYLTINYIIALVGLFPSRD